MTALILGRACTESARVNQKLLPKPLFSDMIRFVELAAAEGLMVAHSGTIHALILDPFKPDHAFRKREAVRFLEGLAPGAWLEVSNY